MLTRLARAFFARDKLFGSVPLPFIEVLENKKIAYKSEDDKMVNIGSTKCCGETPLNNLSRAKNARASGGIKATINLNILIS